MNRKPGRNEYEENRETSNGIEVGQNEHLRAHPDKKATNQGAAIRRIPFCRDEPIVEACQQARGTAVLIPGQAMEL